jgi:hypothetical protein
MKRLHLIEIEDQSWCPSSIRDAATDYLQFVIALSKGYAPIVPLLAAAIERSAARDVLDLCSGGTGPWLWLRPLLAERGIATTVSLTDKYPNKQAFDRLNNLSDGAITYHSESVDAAQVPADLRGFRTMFTAFHHFTPGQARAILADAARQQQPIGIFELTERSLWALVLTAFAPLNLLLFTPWIRPFRWSRLLWTYLIPVLPFVILFDGLVSCLRTYTVKELRDLTLGLDENGYRWEIGAARGKIPVSVTYVIGIPKKVTG